MLKFIRKKINAELGKNKNSSEYFSNPIYQGFNQTVWKGPDYFYMLSSGTLETTLLRSKDMVEWEETGISPFSLQTRLALHNLIDTEKGKNYITSKVIYNINNEDNSYNMYVNLDNKYLVLLVSDNPEGPFTYPDNNPSVLLKDIGDSFNVCQDSENTFLVYEKDSKLLLAFLDRRGYNFSSTNIVMLAKGKFKGVCFYNRTNDFGKNYWYLFVSREDGKLGVVRSQTFINGVYKSKFGFKLLQGNSTVILESLNGIGIENPGNIITDKHGMTYMFFSRSTWDIHLQRIYWNQEGWPYFECGFIQDREIRPGIKLHVGLKGK